MEIAIMITVRNILVLAAAGALVACASGGGSGGGQTSKRVQAIQAAIASPDRPAKDRDEDAKRKPVEVMSLSGVAPGQRVIDIFSSGGWYAELLARTVGPKGQVYAQNPPSVLKRFGDKAIVERLANNRLPNVVRWDKEVNALDLAPNSFDGAMINLVFHDLQWISQDVPGFLKDLHGALKRGAWVAVIDHSAPAGTRDSFAKDPRGQHRIDEAFTRELFEAAGFKLTTTSDILRNPADDRQKSFFAPDMRDKLTDKFIHIYRK
jgi:predicted methyltransferase